MRSHSIDYLSIRGALWALELRFGPFWEPRRVITSATADEFSSKANELEAMLRQLTIGRRRSVLVMAAIAAGWVLLILLVAANPYSPVVVPLFFGFECVLLAVWWIVLWRSRDWWLYAYGTVMITPMPPAPTPLEVVAALRRLCDIALGLGAHDLERALVSIRQTAPLTYRACLLLTVVPSSVKRQLRASA